MKRLTPSMVPFLAVCLRTAVRRAIRQGHAIFSAALVFRENLVHRKNVARPSYGVYKACGPNSAPPHHSPPAASHQGKNMPAYRSRTTTQRRNIASARRLWPATGKNDTDLGKPNSAVVDA